MAPFGMRLKPANPLSFTAVENLSIGIRSRCYRDTDTAVAAGLGTWEGRSYGNRGMSMSCK